MKHLILSLVAFAGYLMANLEPPKATAQQHQATPQSQPPAAAKRLENRAIDMPGYLKIAVEAEQHRQSRRVTEEEFLKMAAEEGTIILDARSKQMYDLLHVKGAVNLSFPDIDMDSLPCVLPDKNARILIYCNNNFTDPENPGVPNSGHGLQAAARQAFRPKIAVASLNISTYIALYGYGYKNVYELAPLIDPTESKLIFER